MDATEIISLLKNFNAVILISGFIIFLLTFLIKKLIPEKLHRIVWLIPFITGIISFGIYYFIFRGSRDLLIPFQKGVQAGGVATFYYAVFKQAYKSSDVGETVKNVLYGIFSDKTVKILSKEIASNFTNESSLDEKRSKISTLIAENASVSEKQCEVLTDIILSALNNDK